MGLTTDTGDNSITNNKLAAMEAQTIKGNATSNTAAPTDLTIAQLNVMANEYGISIIFSRNAQNVYTIF